MFRIRVQLICRLAELPMFSTVLSLMTGVFAQPEEIGIVTDIWVVNVTF
jgi:hypothetical protein